MLPAIFLDCPYRIPFFFLLGQFSLYLFQVVQSACNFLYQWLNSGFGQVPHIEWPNLSMTSFKTAENHAVFYNNSDNCESPTFLNTCQFTCDTLYWILDYSSNQSAKQVVFEGVSGLLRKWRSWRLHTSQSSESFLMSNSDLFCTAVLFTLDKLADKASPSTEEDPMVFNSWFSLIDDICMLFYWQPEPKNLLNSSIGHEEWQKHIQKSMEKALQSAIFKKDHILFKALLKWGHPEILEFKPGPWKEMPLLHVLAWGGTKEDISYMLDQDLVDINQCDDNGETALHWAARTNQLDIIIALVEKEKSLINIQSNSPQSQTALDIAISHGSSDVVAYLSSQGASRPFDALHLAAAMSWRSKDVIKTLLDLGWDRSAIDAEGRTPIDVAYSNDFDEAVEYLKNYQTASIQPYITITALVNQVEKA